MAAGPPFQPGSVLSHIFFIHFLAPSLCILPTTNARVSKRRPAGLTHAVTERDVKNPNDESMHFY